MGTAGSATMTAGTGKPEGRPRADPSVWWFAAALAFYLATRLVHLNDFPGFFFCDEAIRCGKVALPAGRESEPQAGPWETTLYVESGTLSVNLTGAARSLLAGEGEVVFLPPGTEHSLQAIGDEPVVALFAEAS